MKFQSLILIALLTFAAVVSGCSDGKPKRTPVSGRVIFDGLEQPAEGVIYFAPVSGELKRPGFAKFDSSGYYSVTSFGREKQDGLLPGTYKVYVEAFKSVPTPENPNPPSYVPSTYQSADKTPLELVVPPGGKKITQDFTITK
ncbi:MAG: hypothetical protein IKX40_10100 [Thermoguttaceae bacterium]|nr:hypothetical protein [Thermoguttaceae bacterium]